MNTSTCAGPPWSLAFVIIVTSAPSVAFAMLHLSFVHGMTGESLGTLAVQLQRLPLQVDVDALSLELGQSLHGFVVQAQPLQDLLDNSEDDEEDDAEEGTLEWRRLSGLRLGRSHHRKSLSETSVTLHLLRPARIYLRNMRNSRASVWAGWRRWYAEFKEAAAEMPLLSIDVPQYRICNGFHFFGAANVRTLAAIILQAQASTVRHMGGGNRYRSWAGCRHALVRRTGLRDAEVSRFIARWLETHDIWVTEVAVRCQNEIAFFK